MQQHMQGLQDPDRRQNDMLSACITKVAAATTLLLQQLLLLLLLLAHLQCAQRDVCHHLLV